MTRALLLVLAVAFCSVLLADDRQLNTSRKNGRVLPLPKEDGVFHFVVFGDRTGGPKDGVKILAQAVGETNLLGPDLVMTIGDLIEGYSKEEKWLADMREFRGIMGELDMPWFPVAGNHDIYWRGDNRPPGEHEGRFEKHFGPVWYWFEHKKAGFLVLYTDEGDGTNKARTSGEPSMVQMSETQLAWLSESLEKMKSLQQVFVFLHHPRWMASRYKGSNWPKVHELFVKAGNVRAVFAGHVHRMSYGGKKDGIEYFSLSVTGGNIPSVLPEGGWLHHMNVVSVRKDSYTIATIPVGSVIDPREVTPDRWAEVDRARRVAAKLNSSAIAVDSDGRAFGRLSAKLTNPCKSGLEVTLTASSDDALWFFSPEHAHVKLAPGESVDVEVAYLRRATSDAGLKPPTISTQVDYLGEAVRFSLPAKEAKTTLTLGKVVPAYFDACKDHAVRLSAKAAVVRVDGKRVAVPDGPFSIEAWVRFKGLGGRQSVLSKTESSEFGLFLDKKRLVFRAFLDGQYVAATSAEGAVSTQTWHHVAGVFDGKELRLYVDGAIAAKAAGSGVRKRNQLPLFVGADPDGSGKPVDPFSGRIDEVRISSVARYVGDAFTPAVRHAPDVDTLLLLHLDGIIRGFVPDHSPRAAHAKLQGGAKLAPLKAGEKDAAARAF